MHPWSPDVQQCPYQHYDRWREAAPVLWNEALGAWLVLGYDAAAFVLTHDDLFSSTNSIFVPRAAGVSVFPSAINLDPPHHTFARIGLAPAFGTEAVEQHWLPAARRATEAQVAALPRLSFDAVTGFSQPLSLRIIASGMGVEPEALPWLQRVYGDIAAGIGRNASDESDGTGAFVAAIRELRAYFVEAARQRQAMPRPDVLSVIAAAGGGQRLNDDEVAASLTSLFIIGVPALSHCVATLIRVLAEDPTLLARVYNDRDLVWNLVEECLRFDAPVQGLYRKARRDVDFAGVRVYRGDALCVLFAAANRDPDYVEYPSRFRLDEARADHPSFGAGVHACPAAALVRAAAEVIVNTLLDTFETLEPALGHEALITWRAAPFFRAMESYPVRYTLGAPPAARISDSVAPAFLRL